MLLRASFISTSDCFIAIVLNGTVVVLLLARGLAALTAHETFSFVIKFCKNVFLQLVYGIDNRMKGYLRVQFL